MQKILLVDDDENILSGYKRNLRTFFQIYVAISPKTALLILKENKDIGLIISDFRMPEMNGIEFLTIVKDLYPNTVRILLTGNADLEMAIKSVNEGNIFRFLTKPCDQETLKNNISQGIEQYKLIIAEKELLESTLKGSLKILIDILAMVSPAIFSKSILIRNFARKIVSRLNMPGNWEIDISCLLSQIGCVGIPNEILDKRHNGILLTAQENELFISQAQIGNDLLKNIPRLENVATAISMQHKPLNEITLLRNYTADNETNKRIVFISCLLRLLNDYLYFSEREKDEKRALELLWKNKAEYNETLLSALQAEIKGIEDGYLLEYFPLEMLKKGMILGDNLHDKNNAILLPKGSILSEINIIKLRNYAKLGGITEPVLIQIKNHAETIKI
jgi:FixJ family two-component response regulator